jgi:hypothetical protein
MKVVKCKYVKVCEDKQEKSKRQIIEAVNSQIKNFNLISKWRKIKTFVAYLYAYAIGYSFFRKSKLWRQFFIQGIYNNKNHYDKIIF